MENSNTKNNQPKDFNALFEHIKEDLKSYINHRLGHYRLDVLEKTSRIISQLVIGLLLGFLAIIFFSFALIGCAIYIGEVLGSMAAGFGIVALFWLILLVAALVVREQLQKLLLNKTVSLLYRIETEDSKDE